MKNSARKYLNLSLVIGLLSTACARSALTSDKKANRQTMVAEGPEFDPIGNPPDAETAKDDMIITSGQNNTDITVVDTEKTIDKPTDRSTAPETDKPVTDKPVILATVNIEINDTTSTTAKKPLAVIDTTDFTPLSWEKKDKNANEAKEWSQMVYKIIQTEQPEMLNKNSAKDIAFFCPNYAALPRAQRLNFWGEMISSLAFPESGWKATSQMVEKGMGIDPVTKVPVKSEGLLQLSYQDERSYRLDCGFDFTIDQVLPADDAGRTILDPYLNLRCGIKILALQLKKRKAITLRNNVYWSVLRIGGKFSKINEIAKSTKSMKICQKD